jgi:hypothetical protein
VLNLFHGRGQAGRATADTWPATVRDEIPGRYGGLVGALVMGGELGEQALEGVVAEHQLQVGGGLSGGCLAAGEERLFVGGQGDLGAAGLSSDRPAVRRVQLRESRRG